MRLNAMLSSFSSLRKNNEEKVAQQKSEELGKCLYGPVGKKFHFTSTILGYTGSSKTRSSFYERELSSRSMKIPFSSLLLNDSNEEDNEDIEEEDEEESDCILAEKEDEKSTANDSNKSMNSVSYDAMKSRLGPSMLMNVKKLHDIRSLSSSRRLSGEQLAAIEKNKSINEEERKKQQDYVVDLDLLKQLSSKGIPEIGSHRAVIWRVLLGYLPLELCEWEDVLTRERGLYRKLVCELFVEPSHDYTNENHESNFTDNDSCGDSINSSSDNDFNRMANASSGILEDGSAVRDTVDKNQLTEMSRLNALSMQRQNSKISLMNNHETAAPPTISAKQNELIRQSVSDNPLSLHQDSKWAQFFENAQLIDEIRKDVVRTHPAVQFFLESERNLGKRRYAALERILFVWARLNVGVKYVQGMNEIIGTIYFVLATDFNEEWACEAEADSYFLFAILMNEMSDIYVPSLDDADTGIQGRIESFKQLLKLHDPEITDYLIETLGIDPSFYTVRWFSTMLSREFLLEDTILLWDAVFANSNSQITNTTHENSKDHFLRYICVTMIMLLRKDILASDFSTCLSLLQGHHPTHVSILLESTHALLKLERQVTKLCEDDYLTPPQALTKIQITQPQLLNKIIYAYGWKDGKVVAALHNDAKSTS